MTQIIAGIPVPDSAIVRAATELVRDTEDDLLYNHSRRVFFWAALTGERRGLKYDPELLYMGAMFHDMGLTERYSSTDQRFEVDGANTARDFLKSYGVPERDIEDVWIAIALHTTPGIPQHMRPTIALVTAGVEMDVLGIAYDDFSQRTSPSGLRMSSTRSEFQRKHNRSLRQRYHTEALDDLRKRQGRRAGSQRSDIQKDEFLQHHSRITMARIDAPDSRTMMMTASQSECR